MEKKRILSCPTHGPPCHHATPQQPRMPPNNYACPPSPCAQNHRRLWKYNLAPTSFAGSNKRWILHEWGITKCRDEPLWIYRLDASTDERVRAHSHWGKAKTRAKNFFDVCGLFFNLFFAFAAAFAESETVLWYLSLIIWSFSLSRSFSLVVNRPLSGRIPLSFTASSGNTPLKASHAY